MNRENRGMCPKCGYMFDLTTRLEDFKEASPNVGDISFCLNCGTVNQFDEFGVVPVDESKLSLATQAEIRRLKNAWFKVKIIHGDTI